MNSINTRGESITNRNEDHLDAYLRDIKKYNLLSTEREVQLFKDLEIQNPEHKNFEDLDDDTKKKVQPIRTEIINANLRFVVSVAKQYQKENISLEDLINAWNLWLIKAIDRFDYTKWFKFISYAVWRIRQSILIYIDSNGTIRKPLNQERSRQIIQKFIRIFEQTNMRQPTRDEVIDGVHDKLDKKSVLNYFQSVEPLKISSLDAFGIPSNNTDDISLLDITPDSNSKSPDVDLITQNQREEIIKILKSKLKPMEYKVIIEYFGIWQEREKTLEEIAGEIGKSKEHIRQIKDRSLNKLKTKLKKTEIFELFKMADEK